MTSRKTSLGHNSQTIDATFSYNDTRVVNKMEGAKY